jgi:hypothetical protein
MAEDPAAHDGRLRALSLNRKRSPGCSALNSPLPDGCQKLTSSGPLPARYSNHGPWVTPRKIDAVSAMAEA